MGLIFQEPMTALNPVLTIGAQIAETARGICMSARREARDRAIEALRRVGIPSPEQRIDDYPHHLSGGMRQRVMIAMALICEPKLLIADEPTTALDVTIQAQILDLMLGLQEEYGMGIILISHDLGVVSALTERVLIFYLGQMMEDGARRGPVPHPAPSLYRGAAGQHPAAGPRGRAAACDQRHGAVDLRPAARLPLRAALHPCPAGLRLWRAAAGAGGAGPSGGLPAQLGLPLSGRGGMTAPLLSVRNLRKEFGGGRAAHGRWPWTT